jgi:hypothetical protein
MGTWGTILEELRESTAKNNGRPDFDSVRLKYISAIRALREPPRAVIVYASGWLRTPDASIQVSVEGTDVHALMETCHDVDERELDLIIHSPGGSGQTAEQMVDYLRTQFDYIRAFVPLQAKSAATMIALGCDEIVMGKHSELGPIDPQILIPVPEGQRFAPAHAIMRDFERAKEEIGQNVNALPAWTPILRSYAGGLLEFCSQQILLSQEVVARWLEEYMLSHDDAGIPPERRKQRAKEIAEYFGSDASYDRFRTHGRAIRIEELQGIEGLRITALEEDDPLQDAVLSLYHTLDHTFGGAAIKIVENHNGARYVRLQHTVVVPAGLGEPRPGEPEPAPPQAPGVPQPAQPNRAQRRRQDRASRKRPGG